MKKIVAFICSILLCVGTFSSCGGYSDSIEISSVTSVFDETTGITTITISYLDDIEPPLVFEIPKGDAGEIGETGKGIEKIVPVYDESLSSEENKIVKQIIIYYTDGSEPQTFDLYNGKDGVSISGVKQLDPTNAEDALIYPTEIGENDKAIVFIGSDGAYIDSDHNGSPDVFVIPAGKDGEDGDEITDITGVINPDTGKLTVTVKYAVAEEKAFEIDTVTSIREIVSSVDGDNYKLTINYTNGISSEVSFVRPATWLSGHGMPQESQGFDGDFYFDLDSKKIYKKTSGNWGNPIADLGQEMRKNCTVTFEPGEGANVSQKEFSLLYGQSFSEIDYISIPTPIRDGYVFRGWYTNPNTNVNSGNFTDLTPVTGNVTLYAHWAKAYTITFVKNSPEASGTMNAMSVCKYEPFTLSENRFVLRYHTFKGWSTTPDGEVEYSNGDLFRLDVSKNVTLYAVWEENTNS